MLGTAMVTRDKDPRHPITPAAAFARLHALLGNGGSWKAVYTELRGMGYHGAAADAVIRCGLAAGFMVRHFDHMGREWFGLEPTRLAVAQRLVDLRCEDLA